MPSVTLASPRLTVDVDGRSLPDLSLALRRWALTERPKGRLGGELEVDDAGAVWRSSALLRPGAPVLLTLGAEPLFSGAVLALEARAGADEAPSLLLRLRGTRAAAATSATRAPTTLRIGNEVLEAQVVQQAAPAALRLSAVVDGTLATGPLALRVGAPIALHGMGALFDGRFRLQEVTLRFDRDRGLQLAVAGRR